ncbi:MAG: Gfo/Idh/MocA family oxidoreductase [Candidatus Aminicenantes bacterium]|nr:Gfo/Idh/MocA family oxidoreductase [Candidatus Aminicenantes bacterium]
MIEGQEALSATARLTYGMVGGGRGAFIGDVHRKAIAMDGKARLMAGCFSQSYENTLATGEAWGVDRSRLYKTYEEMLQAEGKRADKVDFVVIVTPNDTHSSIAISAIENGIHVVCDKPLTTTLSDARELGRLVKEKQNLFCVTYAYSGYPIVKHMRDMVRNGELGDIRFVSGEYPQEWLATLLEKTGQKQAAWRTDPKRAGASNCVGDIGSHIEHMVSYVTGLKIESLLARLDHFGEGRTLDDNASILLNYEGGAKGMYWSSQVAVGQDNGFRIRVYGTKAGFEWAQEYPNYLRMSYVDRPTEIISRGRDKMSPRAQSLSRIPSGHPEGYFECFANLYSTYLNALAKRKSAQQLAADDSDFPGVEDGIRGVRFIEKCVESSNKGAIWVNF